MAESSGREADFPPISSADETETMPQNSRFRPATALEFEGYEIIEEFPRGGQAIVYKAIHKATGTKVALKVLAPGLLISAKARYRFEREVDLISTLEHPYVVSIRDSGISEGQYYYAMEYIRGLSLDEYVFSQGSSSRQTLELFRKVCEAVAHAHRRGVIHRDLKPSNILVDERGDPHILDFGLAKGAGGSTGVSQATMTGEIGGTLSYMSPEQAAGRSNLVDTRSDVYSLGVILYRLLTGQFPYDVSGRVVNVLRNIESAEPERPRNLISRFDKDVEDILLKSLAKKPSERYSSAAELQDDIQRWFHEIPLAAKSQSSLYVFKKLLRRHRYGAVIAALLTIILLGFSCTYYYLYSQLKAKTAKLERTWTKLYDEREATGQLRNQLAFDLILDRWHKGLRDRVRSEGQQFLDEGGREVQAVEFLLDDRPLPEKVNAFRRQLADSEPFFTTFVLAEHHLYDGDRQKALTLYRQSLRQQAGSMDGILRYRVQKKIVELMEAEDSMDP